jgi:hypothetical protein
MLHVSVVNDNNTTGYITSAKAKKLYLNKKPGNSTINKTPLRKSIPV